MKSAMKNINRKLNKYIEYLKENEKAEATIAKYKRDIQQFLTYVESINKEEVIRWKRSLEQTYKVSSRNSMLVSINQFLTYIGKADCKVKLYCVQRETYIKEEKNLDKVEYKYLLNHIQKDRRIRYIIQTIGSTGIRISELKYITVESLNKQKVEVKNKGKERTIFLSTKLCKLLQKYCKKRKITKGMIFITRTGKAVDRSNIWKEMKQLTETIQIKKEKLYPHNLRHLFAKTYYEVKHDIVKLADILGHSNINTTRIYTKITQKEQQKELEKLDLVYI